MKALTLLLPFISVYIALCTTVDFINHCFYGVTVIKTPTGEAAVQECYLNPEESCTRTYGGNATNFRNNWDGKTLAEFTFNSWNNMDYYDLNIIDGYDTPMQIWTEDTGCPTVTCQSPGCPDAYQFPGDDSKTHTCHTGGTFHVSFCP